MRRKDGAEFSEPDDLATELRRERDLEAARRTDELERTRAEAGHGRARADVAEESRLAEMARAEREADVRANAELARMYREFRTSGARTQIRADMARSGEARALRLETLRNRNLWYLVPLLIGFGAWSTTGVQQGAARLMHVDKGDPVWWALWGLEALLIGVVCRVIVVRARLASSGGELEPAAERIAWGCLTTSVFLNLIAALPLGDVDVSGWAVPGAMFAHAIGPVGAALTAHLIGVFDKSIAAADPWHEKQGTETVAVPRLATMDLNRPASLRADSSALGSTSTLGGSAAESGPQSASESAATVPAVAWPVDSGQRRTLPVIARPEPVQAALAKADAAPRSAAEQPGRPVTEAPRKPRVDKGTRVPESAKPVPRALTDEEQCERLVAAIDRGELSESASIRQVQSALGVGFDRAKRIKELYEMQLADMESAVVKALPERDEPLASPTRAGLAVVGGER